MKTHYLASIILCLCLIRPSIVQAADAVSGQAAQLASASLAKPDDRKTILSGYLKDRNSPLEKHAETLVNEADKYGLDWKFLAAISGLESSFCLHIPQNSFNCWGWGIPTGASSGIGFKSYQDAIVTISRSIRERYMDRGYVTVDQIGSVYAASPTWSVRIKSIMKDIEQYMDQEESELPDFTL